MKSFNLTKFLPCAVFFANGRVASGVIALLMQATLVLWPVASRWAFQLQERQGIEALLDELSDVHGMGSAYASGAAYAGAAKVGQLA